MATKIITGVVAFGMLLTACTAPKPAVVKKDPGLYIQPHEVAVKVKDGWLTAKTISLGDYTTSSRTNGVAANTPPKQWRGGASWRSVWTGLPLPTSSRCRMGRWQRVAMFAWP